ncbi:MAG: hypothetical protein V2G48_04110 [bacterium JZ-2024 1]
MGRQGWASSGPEEKPADTSSRKVEGAVIGAIGGGGTYFLAYPLTHIFCCAIDMLVCPHDSPGYPSGPPMIDPFHPGQHPPYPMYNFHHFYYYSVIGPHSAE